MAQNTRLGAYPWIIIGLITTLMSYGSLSAQSPASYGQQLAVVKSLRPDLITVGIMTTSLSQKALENIARAATGQGIRIVVAKPQDPTQIASLYNQLVVEKKIELLWIPDAEDRMLLGMGFEFLREKALGDKIGIMVPDGALVSTGALCSVQAEEGKLKAYVSRRIASIVGAVVPSESSPTVTYVTR